MNPLLMNYFIGGLIRQTKRDLKKAGIGENFGELLTMSYFVLPDETIKQRITFENESDSNILSAEEKSNFEKMLDINVHKEMIGDNLDKKPCRTIFATINAKNKVIVIEWKYTDGTNRILNL